jgi:hypothetical protein
MTAARYENLAGATLDHVTIDWRNATARVTFLPTRGSHEAHALRVSELTRLHVDRAPHASRVVREVTRTEVGGRVSVSIAMESTEVVQIDAGVVVLESIGG